MAPSDRSARAARSARTKPARGRGGDYVFEPGEGWVEEPAVGRVSSADASAAVGARGTVVVGRETKGRKGAGVTVVKGLSLGDQALASLARELKQLCATGGTVRGGTVELQGEHRDRVVAELTKRGWPARRSGA